MVLAQLQETEPENMKCPFEKAGDSKMVWDEGDLPAHCPLQHVYRTAERPDIVVWSDEGNEVILYCGVYCR